VIAAQDHKLNRLAEVKEEEERRRRFIGKIRVSERENAAWHALSIFHFMTQSIYARIVCIKPGGIKRLKFLTLVSLNSSFLVDIDQYQFIAQRFFASPSIFER
jgi:hypothetical protein